MAKKKDIAEALDERKLILLANQKPVTLLTDQELEMTAQKHGIDFEGGLQAARMLSIIHDLEEKVKILIDAPNRNQ